MSAIGAVIGCFEAGKAYEDEGKFLSAARNYYQCHLYYEEGELPVFYEQVQEYGCASLGCYYRCKGKMSKEDKAKLRADEVAISFLSSWRDKADYLEYMALIDAGHSEYVLPNDEDKSALTDALEEGRAVGGDEADLLSGENCRTVRKKYEVCWQFCEQFGNEAQYRLQGGTMKGPLSLDFVDYGVFKVCTFRIDVDPLGLFEFVQPDLLRVKSYRFLGEEKAVFDDE